MPMRTPQETRTPTLYNWYCSAAMPIHDGMRGEAACNSTYESARVIRVCSSGAGDSCWHGTRINRYYSCNHSSCGGQSCSRLAWSRLYCPICDEPLVLTHERRAGVLLVLEHLVCGVIGVLCLSFIPSAFRDV